MTIQVNPVPAVNQMTRVFASTAVLIVAISGARANDASMTLSPQQVSRAEITTFALGKDAPGGLGRVSITGRVEIPEDGPAPILAPTQARVVAVYAHPGDSVQAGAPIVALAGPEVAVLRRSLEDATALSRSARQQTERDRSLFDEGIIAKSRLEKAMTAAAIADGQLGSQRQILGSARFQSGGRLLLRAPRSGLVSGPAFGTGEALAIGELIAYIGEAQAPLVSLDAPAAVSRTLRVGDELRVHSHGCEERAVLHAIGRTVDPNSQTVALHAEVAGPSCLLPGEIITASITPRSLASDAFPVPAAAFVQRGNGTFVFTRSAEGFTPVVVDSAAARAGYARASGLSAGTLVVVQGAALLKAEWLKRGSI